jgi:hypothetical protein
MPEVKMDSHWGPSEESVDPEESVALEESGSLAPSLEK